MSEFWNEDPLHARRRKRSPWPARIALGAVLTVLVAVVAWGALSLIGDKKPAKKQVMNIALVAPPPPPPPPPEVKPPEPEVQEEVKVPEPEQPPQAQEAPPAGEQLGLDAEGSGAGDGFGLAAKKGGRDITQLGGPTTANRAQFAWFTALVQGQLQSHLHDNEKLRKADYRIVLRVWFGRDGGLDRYELVGSTGSAELDRDLKLAMDSMPRLQQAPPVDMPQPVKLRVTSRGAG
jgi:protein TonB